MNDQETFYNPEVTQTSPSKRNKTFGLKIVYDKIANLGKNKSLVDRSSKIQETQMTNQLKSNQNSIIHDNKSEQSPGMDSMENISQHQGEQINSSHTNPKTKKKDALISPKISMIGW